MLVRLIDALRNSKELISKLADGTGGIYHQVSPKGCRYPNIVYSVVSDVPALHGDDVELQSILTLRIHIVTRDGAYEEIFYCIRNIMSQLGFMRLRTTEAYIENLKVLIVDYTIGVDM